MLERYPDAALVRLKRDVASAYALAPDNLVFGNGSDEFFSLVGALFLASGDEAVISEHSFLLYRTQILTAGAVPVIVKEVANKTSIDSMLKAVTTKTRLVFATSPANPTGTLLTSREITTLRRALPAKAVLVLDLAYTEYVKDDRLATNKILIEPNVITTRTFSKIHGLAALRIGWSHSAAEFAKAISKIKSPFNVNALAQAGGASAVSSLHHCRASSGFNLFWITKLVAALKTQHLLLACSAANFVTAKFAKRVPIAVVENLTAARGAIVRGIADYKLFNSIRMSLGCAAANELLVRTLLEIGQSNITIKVHASENSKCRR